MNNNQITNSTYYSPVSNKELFIIQVKHDIENILENATNCPSVVAALACKISDFGSTMSHYFLNLYNYRYDKTWFGKVYSGKSYQEYESAGVCPEVCSPLYRVYSSTQESIEDFISYLENAKRSENGPKKYPTLDNCYNYKEFINILTRNDFFADFVGINNDINYIQDIIAIIEKYKLYELDDKLKEINMSKKKKYYNANNNTTESEDVVSDNIEEENETEEDNKVTSTMYRVRLDWDKPGTQLFASPSFEDCKEEALKHEGYKIYGEDGELIEDPWEEKRREAASKAEITNTNVDFGLILPSTGGKVILTNTPIYNKPYSVEPRCYGNGVYYFYDYTITNGRVKITENANIANDKKKNPSMIYGYINVRTK